MAAHTYISLFSGVGMLDVAVGLALPGAKCVGYCEREGPAAAILAHRMGQGDLDEAPIYSDVRTFPSELYLGRVAGIIGGFPCQDLSVAGRQAGITGERSGLFFDIIRLVRELESIEWLFLENVPPVLAFPAGPTVLGELAALGFDAEWGTIRASDVGAPHRRERAFILAYRNVADAASRGSGQNESLADGIRWTTRQEPERYGCDLAHTQLHGRDERRAEPSWQPRRPDAAERGGAVEDTEHAQRRKDGALRWESGDVGASGGAVGHAEDERHERSRSAWDWRGGPADAGPDGDASHGVGLADSERLRRQQGEPDQSSRGMFDAQCGEGLPLFPPGPGDLDAWREILAVRPDLAPAVESGVRRVAHGTASRVDRLRQLGNGVVALQGAAAFVALAQRAGLFEGELFGGAE